jgi:hypothetical protein
LARRELRRLINHTDRKITARAIKSAVTPTKRAFIWCPNSVTYVLPPPAVPTNGDIRAQDFDAAEKAGCSIGGGSTGVESLWP